MGLLKKLFKGAKKIFKGIGKAFKKLASSKLGKALLIGAAIFIGGAALNLWQGPSWLGGAGSVGQAAAGDAAVAGTLTGDAVVAAGTEAAAGGTLGSALGGEAAAAAAGEAAAGATAAGSAMTPGAISLTTATPEMLAADSIMAQQVGLGGFTSAIPAAAPSGLLSQVGAGVKGVAGWMGKNPIPTLVAGNMIQGFMQPDPYEQWRKQEQWKRDNSNVAGVYGDGRSTDLVLPTSGLVSQVNQAQRS